MGQAPGACRQPVSPATSSLRSVLVEDTERRRVDALASLPTDRQSRLGQFFTPDRAAALIARMPRLPEAGTLRVLDPGAGVGSLSAALVERVRTERPDVRLHVVCVELDEFVMPWLRETLSEMASENVTTEVLDQDFLLGADDGGAGPLDEPFDLVLMNPPYGKLAADSTYRAVLQGHGVECPNLYAAFMALGHRMLAPGGQLVAIVPRSFANGAYFTDFRRDLLGALTIDQIHEFGSRSTVFSDTGVLQENIILSATKAGTPGPVTLSLSSGHRDAVEMRTVDYETVVIPGDRHRFIRLPSITATDSPTSTLEDLELQVSTGKVVDFRARDLIRHESSKGAVPLIYPGNVRAGEVHWPLETRKPQWFVAPDSIARKQLLPEGIYVVIKRFSAKEERRRVVAAVWEHEGPVAFENHLNVIHRFGRGLDVDLAIGLSLWLNSTPLDILFREFSGHTQVNATDLRTLPFPDEETLRAWGTGRTKVLPSQTEIDALVSAA